ncbi:hypothetical protein Godav_014242 [Gossypium davidsonii]|uniref:Uncharacterized protein n=3 Tax=Gossypium TaxID=3633 RepID=A0A7J8RJJ2_GOSDV|nr:hypothetical protein [Gossypium davidsonii]
MTSIDLTQRSRDCMMDGHKDGMPNLPPVVTNSLKKIFHFIVEVEKRFQCQLFAWFHFQRYSINKIKTVTTDTVTAL